MSNIIATYAEGTCSDDTSEKAVHFSALKRLLDPLARFCLASGISFALVEDELKKSFVHEAKLLQPGAPEHGMVSRISTATGINRREVTRLVSMKESQKPSRQPLVAEVFARWTTDPAFRAPDGGPDILKRQGPSPSFEALAQTVSRDVHHRSVLDELVRLELAHYDEENSLVRLTRTEFVPRVDSQLMIGFLGDNVGDHLNAAVDNVLHGGDKHFEQAVFADELSAESIYALRPLVINCWQMLCDAMVPVITELIEADRQAGRVQNQRARVGLYTFAETEANTRPAPLKGSARRYRKPTVKDSAA